MPELTKFDTNWNDLPTELKVECILKMDFKTRTSIGCTSRSNRTLVAPLKSNFDRLKIGVDKSSFYEQGADRVTVPFHVARHILSTGNIDMMAYVHSNMDNLKELEELTSGLTFNVKSLYVNTDHKKTVEFWLSKCPNAFENCVIVCREANFSEEVWKVPTIANTKRLMFSQLKMDSFLALAETWFNEDVELGKTFLTRNTPNDGEINLMDAFLEKF